MSNIVDNFRNQYRYYGDSELDFDSSLMPKNRAAVPRSADIGALARFMIVNADFFSKYDYSWVVKDRAFSSILEFEFQCSIFRVLIPLFRSDPERYDCGNICVRVLPTGESADQATESNGYRYIVAATQYDRILSYHNALMEDVVVENRDLEKHITATNASSNITGFRSLLNLFLLRKESYWNTILKFVTIYGSSIQYAKAPLGDIGLVGLKRWGLEMNAASFDPALIMQHVSSIKHLSRASTLTKITRNFSLYHELSHILLHSFDNPKRTTKEELEADTLALYLARIEDDWGSSPMGSNFSNFDQNEHIQFGYDAISSYPDVACGTYLGIAQCITFFQRINRYFELPESKLETDPLLSRINHQIAELNTRIESIKGFDQHPIQGLFKSKSASDTGNVTNSNQDLVKSYDEAATLVSAFQTLLLEWGAVAHGQTENPDTSLEMELANTVIRSIFHLNNP